MRIVPLIDAGDPDRFGGKAAQLAAALQAGLPVPSGFALDAPFVAAVLRGDADGLSHLDAVSETLDGPVAVRSSAVGEDSATASFAGQHASVLNARGARAIRDAIGEVWRSASTDAARAYRARLGAPAAVQVGVVLQRMVQADVAGVLFTRNPVTGSDEIVIEASWGLGEAIVQGLVIPDRFRLAREGRVVEAKAGLKDTAVRLDPAGGTRREKVPTLQVEALCLGERDLSALLALACGCDATFGEGPHDLEWAVEVGRVYLLQRRPVTTLASLAR